MVSNNARKVRTRKKGIVMPGISKTRNIDDIRIHLKQIRSADDVRKLPHTGETAAATKARQGGVLPLATRARVDMVLAEVQEHAPEMGEAQKAKFGASRAAKEAVALGMQALARVDSHLQAVTQEREPLAARNYGVYGPRPKSMAAVSRALLQCQVENARIKALPALPLPQDGDAVDAEANAERALVFTPVVEAAVDEAVAALESLVGGRLSTRAELSRQVSFKAALIERALACIAEVRNHLYANLPLRRRDPDLRDYGFRPIRRRTATTEDGSQNTPRVDPVVAAASVTASRVLSNAAASNAAASNAAASNGPVSVR
jgi:hypothetical protein